MSDQHKASGEPSARQAGSAAAPGTETVTAGPVGGTGSAPGTGGQVPAAGAGETAGAAGTTRSPASRDTGSGAVGGAGAQSGSAGASEAEDAGTGSAEAGDAATADAQAADAKPGDTRAEGTRSDGVNGAAGKADGVRAAGGARAWKGRRGIAAAAGPGGDGAAPDDDAPGRPGKPVLAGAAMVGAILVAIPLLVMAVGRDEEKKAVSTGAAENILRDEDDPAGAFVAEAAPSASSSRARATKEAEAAEERARSQRTEQAAPKPQADPGKTGSGKTDPGTAAAEPRDDKPTAARPRTGADPQKKRAGRRVAQSAPVRTPPLTRVLIKNNTNGTCVDIPGYSSGRPDTEVHHFTCNNTSGDNQLWNVEKRYNSAGPGGAPLYQIRNVMDSMCLDLPGNHGVGEATMVTEYPCNGTTGDNQLWWLDKQADGKYWIRNFASNNQCLDSYSNSETERQLLIWPCAPESQNNHEWIFTRS